MSMTKCALWVLPCVTLVFSDCSPANVMATGGPDPTTIKEACHDYAYAYCARLATCSPTAIAIKFATSTTCETVQEALCVARLSAPGTGSSPAGTAACQKALGSWDCGDFIYSTNPPPECQTPAGTLPSGSACSVNPQCKSSYCGNTAHHVCGTCTAAPVQGDSCAEDICPQGLVCRGATPACTAYAESGTTCSSAVPCAEGLACVGGVCQPGAKTAGATCTLTQAGCDPYRGLACDASTSTCVTLHIANPGEACGVVGSQDAWCVAGTCPRGACVPFGNVGDPCELNGSVLCMGGLHCIVTSDGGTSGTCQVPGAASCM
jgi:hypothetical protein